MRQTNATDRAHSAKQHLQNKLLNKQKQGATTKEAKAQLSAPEHLKKYARTLGMADSEIEALYGSHVTQATVDLPTKGVDALEAVAARPHLLIPEVGALDAGSSGTHADRITCKKCCSVESPQCTVCKGRFCGECDVSPCLFSDELLQASDSVPRLEKATVNECCSCATTICSLCNAHNAWWRPQRRLDSPA